MSKVFEQSTVSLTVSPGSFLVTYLLAGAADDRQLTKVTYKNKAVQKIPEFLLRL